MLQRQAVTAVLCCADYVWCARMSVTTAKALEPAQFAQTLTAALPHPQNNFGIGRSSVGATQCQT